MKQFYNQNKYINKIERNKNDISDDFLFYCDMKYWCIKVCLSLDGYLEFSFRYNTMNLNQ